MNFLFNNTRPQVSPAPLSTDPRKTVYTSSPSPQDTGFKKTGSEVGPKKGI